MMNKAAFSSHVRWHPPHYSEKERGLTYLYVMFVVVVIGISLAAIGQFWHISRQRENERELLFIGNQFRQAIGDYYYNNAARADRYPHDLKVLLEDRNHLPNRRYLRMLYRDPFTNKAEWGLVKNPQEGIVGIYSLHEGVPIKVANFEPSDAAFANAKRYADWQFNFVPQNLPQTRPASSSTSTFSSPPH